MKTLALLLLFMPCIVRAQPGSSCATAIPLTFSSPPVPNNFPPGNQPGCLDYSTLGMPTGPSASDHAGNGPVMWFSFVYQNCQQVWIQPSGITTIDVTVYNASCGSIGTGINGQQQSLDLRDGSGWWSTSTHQGAGLIPGNTYHLRMRFGSGYTGSVKLCAYQNAGWQTNTVCNNAVNVGPAGIWHNNACAFDNDLDPASGCATTLDNTAFYSVTITAPTQYINFGAINCPSCIQEGSYPGGMCPTAAQIGFFQGECDNLIYIGCQTVIGNTSFQTTGFPIGTVLYFTVDGREEANCNYSIYFQNFPLSIATENNRVYPIRKINKDAITILSNPIGNELKMEVYSTIREETELTVYDQLSRVIHQQKINLRQGMNTLTIPQNWTPGAYYVTMRLNQRLLTQKLVRK